MLTKNNFYLLNLFLTLLGVNCFLFNVKSTIHIPGLLLASVVLMITPVTLIALNWDSHKLSRLQSLSLIFIPLIFLNYIYYIKMGLPVGFGDMHNHIFECSQLFDENGNILFTRARHLSFNFVGLYVIFHFLTQICNLDLVILASIIPPLFNILIIVWVYIIANKLHSHKVALVATLLFGWEYAVLVFGQEMRTQTIGTLLLFSILGFMLIFQKSAIKAKSLWRTIALLIMLFALVTTSFVSIFYSSILFFMIIVTSVTLNTLKWPNKTLLLTGSMFGLFLIFFMFYMLYIGVAFNAIASSLISLFNVMMTKTEAPTLMIGNQIYGTFVYFVARLFWLVFLVFSLPYSINIFRHKNFSQAIFFTGFGVLLTFGVIMATFGPLSSSRTYIVGFILMAIVVSFGFFKLQDIQKKQKIKNFVKIFACLIILMFITASLIKMPSYIIGETVPLRANEPTDLVFYWKSDLPQYAVSEFLSSSAENQSIHPHMYIKNYAFLQVCQRKGLNIKDSLDYKGHFINAKIKPNELLVLHDKFNGRRYTPREIIPKSLDYMQFDKIYSNTDYVVYKSR